MPRCAFLTLSDPTGYVMDDDLAHEPMRELGWSLDTLPWDSTGVDWGSYDITVIRSTWDYQHQVAKFLATLANIEKTGCLQNSVAIVRDNIEKTYLRSLAARGIPTMPTLWRDRLQPGELPSLFNELDTTELVIKPTISATAQGAWRLTPATASAQASEIEAYYANRALLVQPFLGQVVSEGEYSLFYFNGDYSHAILKAPKTGDFRVQEEHGGLITAIRPDALMHRAGERAMAALEESTLYARVDLVRTPEGGDFWLMEFELIEPALYLRMDPGAPMRFARAVVKRAGG